ncbi:MAG: LptF/LptG family permease [Candidatus Sericytochromatia bacterium]
MILERYLLRELLGPFALALLVLGCLMTTGFVLFGLIEESAQFHFSLALMGQIVLLRLPEMLFYTLPMAVLLGTLLAVARLSNDQELLSLRVSGLSFWRFSAPFLLFSLLIGGVTVGLNESLVPPATWLARQLLQQARSGKLELPRSQEHLLLRDSGPEGLRHLIYARRSQGESLEGVVVQVFVEQRLRGVLSAERARFNAAGWQFERGELVELNAPDGRLARLRFARYALPLPATLAGFLNESRQPLEMNWGELGRHIAALERAGQSAAALKVRQQQKAAVPLAAVPFAGLGCVLGARTLRSRSQGLGLSLMLIFVYYLLMSIGTALGDGGQVPPWLGAWLPHLLLLPVIGGLLARRNQRA